MKLVIVESPAKCETIGKYLDNNIVVNKTKYVVKASKGHIRDLANSGKGGLGVDVENNFVPNYKIKRDKYEIVKELKEWANKCDEVILATDPDREGEAIAWHLAEVLKLDPKKTKRLEFHEITRDSITEAFKNPRTIDESIVSSQESRRIIDRIIGYKLSNLMQRKLKSKSAGRVQSATLRIIAEHEREIASFVPEEYWDLTVKTLINNKEVNLELLDKTGKALKIENEQQAKQFLNHIPEVLKVVFISKSIRLKEAKEPFKTSTLQQEAFSKLKLKTSVTASIAQKLYEGFEVGGEHVGLITYTRTDTTRVSPSFVARANTYITEHFGKEYLGSIKQSKGNNFAQDAHEAIRHTSSHRTPESLKPYLSNDEYRLYKLIYNRTLASLMKPKKEEVTTVVLDGGDIDLKFEVAKTIFDGYEILEPKSKQKEEVINVTENDTFPVSVKTCEQKFTQPPAHLSEAKVVNIMEELGIGRPSTYVPTLQNLVKSKYIEDKNGVITITPHGDKTAFVLVKYFPEIINVNYTAQIEEKLDEVQSGDNTKTELLSSFYEEFDELFQKVSQVIYSEGPEYTGEYCPVCGEPLIYREGKHGKFVGCSNFPTCKYIVKEEVQTTGETCPDCGSPLVIRKNAKGKEFVACSNYPTCKYIKPEENPKPETAVKPCPVCGGNLVKKKGKYGYFLGCTNYPKCNYMEGKFKKGKGAK